VIEHQELLSGLVRLHVLHHAAEDDLYGHWMIEELARHGYKISPGTLYPMLHALERKGYLKSHTERAGRSQRRIYRATPYGVEGLRIAREKLQELVREVSPVKHPRRQTLQNPTGKGGSRDALE
jgi:DNA-binding PadR family transcriptional regulator